MNYTLHQLQVFVKVAELKSITKASEVLHLTQPAVSIQIKNFQDQFDIPLTEIIGRQLHVTAFGKEIASAASLILDQVNAINNKTASFRGQLSGKLKISVVSTGKYIIPYFLSDFMKLHPEVTLELDVTNKAGVVKNLENNEVDFSLVSLLPAKIATRKLELMQNKLYLVSGKSMKLNKSDYSKKILETLPLIFREQGSATRLVVEQFILRNKLDVRKKLELTSNEAVKQAVISGLGSAVLPLIGMKNELQNGDLQIIPTKGFPIKSRWNLIWLKGKKFSPVAEAYLDYLQKNKPEIIKQKFDWYENY